MILVGGRKGGRKWGATLLYVALAGLGIALGIAILIPQHAVPENAKVIEERLQHQSGQPATYEASCDGPYSQRFDPRFGPLQIIVCEFTFGGTYFDSEVHFGFADNGKELDEWEQYLGGGSYIDLFCGIDTCADQGGVPNGFADCIVRDHLVIAVWDQTLNLRQAVLREFGGELKVGC